MQLPKEERLELASEILALAEHEGVDPGAEAAWSTEIERRAERALSGESKAVAWSDVESRVRAVVDKN